MEPRYVRARNTLSLGIERGFGKGGVIWFAMRRDGVLG